MKKLNLNILQKFILVFCLSLFAISCSSDNADYQESKIILGEGNLSKNGFKKDEYRFKSEQFNTIGEKHNLLLEKLYTKLKEDVDSNNISIIDNESLGEYLKKELLNPEYRFNNEISSKDVINENVDAGIKTFEEIREVGDIKFDNEKVRDYLLSLERIVKENTDVVSKIKNLEKRIENDLSLSNKDLFILFSGTSIGKSSYEYWSKNSNAWLLNLNSPKGLNNIQNNFSGKCSWLTMEGPNSCAGQLALHVVVGDVIGAIGAAFGAALVNIVIGPGQAVYAAAILGGGGGASAVAGATWLWNHYTNP